MTCHAGCTDVHTHVVPHDFPRYAGSGIDIPWPAMAAQDACHRHVLISGKHYRTVSDGAWSTSRRLADMRDLRVERQVLSPMPELLSYWLPAVDAQSLIRYINDEIAGMVASAPDRFLALGGVPLQDLDLALQELEYVTDTLGFAGVELASHVNGVSIGDKRFEPFFAEAARRGASVFVHALRPSGKERVVGAFPEQAVCFPGDIALAATSLITSGMASRHPQLRIAFSHGGGGLAMLLPRLVQAWHQIPKARDSLWESPETIARRFFYDALVFSPVAVRFLLDTFGQSQILLGSDYPFGMGDKDPVTHLEAVGLDDTTLQAILHHNPRRFLGLDI